MLRAQVHLYLGAGLPHRTPAWGSPPWQRRKETSQGNLVAGKWEGKTPGSCPGRPLSVYKWPLYIHEPWLPPAAVSSGPEER